MRFIELGRERGQKIKVSCTANAITSMPKKKKTKALPHLRILNWDLIRSNLTKKTNIQQISDLPPNTSQEKGVFRIMNCHNDPS